MSTQGSTIMRLLMGAFGTFVLFALTPLNVDSQGGEPQVKHPHMHQALYELREAKKELVETKQNYGGHMRKAQGAIIGAIKSIDIALKKAKDTIKGAATAKDLAEEYKKYPHHPH